MKLIAIVGTCLLLGLVNSAPTPDEEKVVIDEIFFPESLVIYTGEHDIVNILVALNILNFADIEDVDEYAKNITAVVFFTEADKDAEGKRVDKGLYVIKGNVTTKLLDNGREAAGDTEDSTTAYFAAKDGIYKYNAEETKAEKYGTIDDSIISIAKVNASDLIYILTEDHVLYKVTEEGTKKEKVPEVENAQQIVLDLEGNLYYYTSNKEVYVYNSVGVKKVEGLKASPSSIDLLKPYVLSDAEIPAVVDDEYYNIYPNGTAEAGDIKIKAKPTAYGMEAILILYYGYNKKIYKYNPTVLLTEIGYYDMLEHFMHLPCKKHSNRKLLTKVNPLTFIRILYTFAKYTLLFINM